MTATLFFGYGSKPEINRDTLFKATRRLTATGLVDVTSWEDLKVSGRIIIGRILEAIDTSDVCAFDVTTLNENVLFELGYAIARAKPIWITFDGSDDEARAKWNKFQLLKGVGYVAWTNADHLVTAFRRDRPDEASSTLYDDLIEPSLGTLTNGSLFYMPPYHDTEPSRQVARRLELERRRHIRVVSADPTESALEPLQWYAAKAYETECGIVHFDAPRRSLADVHNPRSALVAGLVRGFDRPVLLLAEEGYDSPLDYEDLLQVYNSSRECRRIVDAWLTERDLKATAGSRSQRVKLSAELRTLRFGEHVAENEIDTLADYFVQTSAFSDVIAERNTLFVGRKGTGKTANMLQAAATLSEDARNLVVVIKPPSYEFNSLVALLARLPPSLQQYSVEGLWKFLLQSEIANSVVETIEARPVHIPYTEDEKKLIDFIDQNRFGIREDFGTRFETAVTALEGLEIVPTNESEGRDLLNEALHYQLIARLRKLLGPVLKSRNRVAVLIDNLDKGWERAADLDTLSKLLLGLLSATGRVTADFSKEDYWRDRIKLTVATFLRSDIYAHLQEAAREPDKLSVSLVNWADPEVLLTVIEERFLAARPEGTSADELWTRFFCPSVNGVATREFLISRALPRPRDIIYFCNSAATIATNRQHERIQADDVLSAESIYSQFAFEALLVENGITIEEFQSVLFAFLGEPWILAEARVRELIATVDFSPDVQEHVLRRLKEVAFLGIETAPGRFEFPESGHASERAQTLAQKYVATLDRGALLSVHPAYRAYLELSAP